MRRIAGLTGIACSLALVVACTGSTEPTTGPTFVVPASQAGSDVDKLALDAASTRLDLILNSGIEPAPLIMSWDEVQAGTLLTGARRAAFCSSLESSHAADGLASLVGAGLNALSMRLRHKPLAEEADTILQAAATFATASCPLWVPVVHPAATPDPTPEPDWRPEGFLSVVGDLNLVWRWSERGTYSCSAGITHCLRVDVYARDGCATLEGNLAFQDPAGVVLDTARTVVSPVLPQQVTPIGFGTTLSNASTGTLTHLICT